MAGRKWKKGPTGKILKNPAGQIATGDGCCCGVVCCGRSLPATLYAEITVDSDCACWAGYPTQTIPIVYGTVPSGVNECFEWFGSVDMCVTGGNLQSLWVGLCCRGENNATDLTLTLGGCSAATAGGIPPDFDPTPTCDPLFLSFTNDAGTGGFDLGACCDPNGTGLGRILSVIIRETP